MPKNIKKALIIAGILALYISMIIGDSLLGVQAANLKQGSTGDQVKKVQQLLKDQGLYTGNVDGIFGALTAEAVKKYQRNNGLVADGIVGPATMKKMGIANDGESNPTQGTPPSGGSSNDLYLLACVVYGEARGEPYEGKVAVAAVVLNRVKDPRFPNTISGVVYQPGAFTCVADGQIRLTPDEEAYRAARDAMSGSDPTNGCVFYYNPATATSKWIFSLQVTTTIGKHRFCL